MSISEIQIFEQSSVDIPRAEILRYSGAKEETPEVAALIDECLSEFLTAAKYKACLRKFDIVKNGDCTDFGFACMHSASLAKFLKNCGGAVIFAATAGAGIDRLIKKYSLVSPSKALIISSIGSAAVESWCDIITENFDRKNRRFSPGYGDLALDVQPNILNTLNAAKLIGVTLGSNLLMSPSKTVTAIIGTEREQA